MATETQTKPDVETQTKPDVETQTKLDVQLQPGIAFDTNVVDNPNAVPALTNSGTAPTPLAGENSDQNLDHVRMAPLGAPKRDPKLAAAAAPKPGTKPNVALQQVAPSLRQQADARMAPHTGPKAKPGTQATALNQYAALGTAAGRPPPYEPKQRPSPSRYFGALQAQTQKRTAGKTLEPDGSIKTVKTSHSGIDGGAGGYAHEESHKKPNGETVRVGYREAPPGMGQPGSPNKTNGPAGNQMAAQAKGNGGAAQFAPRAARITLTPMG